MISIKNEQEIDLMRKSGKITYDILMKLKDYIKPGMSTRNIDRYVRNYITSHDATPAFLGYEGYPASTCISINDMVVHGIPDNTIIKDGDIVSVDVGSIYKGYYSDSAYTYMIGNVDPKTRKLVEDTQKALYEGISVVKEGIKLNDVCSAIGKVAKDNGYGVFECLTGHGVGTNLHEDPYIPNYGTRGSGPLLKEGMCLAVEPMVTQGSFKIRVLSDGWTAKTKDGKLSCHYENSIVITKDGFEILTKAEGPIVVVTDEAEQLAKTKETN